VVVESIEEARGRAFASEIAIAADLPSRAEAIADAAALKRTLTNVLSNALAFTPARGAIRVTLREERHQLVIAVADSGYGFSPAEARDAGKPFARFDRPGAPAGSGLGLAVATTLARRMGGSLRVTGSPGDGASVELRLKRA
jgi:signal transduction histidine kinase